MGRGVEWGVEQQVITNRCSLRPYLAIIDSAAEQRLQLPHNFGHQVRVDHAGSREGVVVHQTFLMKEVVLIGN